MKLACHAAALLLLAAAPTAAQQASAAADPAARADSIFARFSGDSVPGCAVGVTREGRPVLARAYGMAELEHGVANTPATIFEAGSVSKQFTAAAAVLLALDGKLSLDDDVRAYVPELPDYGAPITIRHLLNHTSGLRDWGSVAALGGWPRTTRVHTHEHMLDIASRQKALNYPPGEHYSYTNTGYNLQAVLVERVSGMPFAEFSRERIFEPLGLKDTQWRDDFTRLVPGRAQAYRPTREGGWHLLMPFENVHGNGGLLTTVADLLRWTENLENGGRELGGAAFVEEMHRQGVLNNGRTISYAGGLRIGEYRGVPQVGHSGSTAGYRAYLARYPEQDLAVAVLCNAASASAPSLAHGVVDFYLGDALAAAGSQPDRGEAAKTVELPAERLGALAGLYRDTRTHRALRLALRDGVLRFENGPPLAPLSESRFRVGSSTLIAFDDVQESDARAAFLTISADGDTTRYEPVADLDPTPERLAEYAGTYVSDEAEAAYTVELRDGALALRGRYGDTRTLEPLYPDAFRAGGNIFRFLRDESGRITALSAASSRVWDLRFERRR